MKNDPKKSDLRVVPASRKLEARFFVADDIRTESSGKQILIGFYPDSVLVMEVPPGAPLPSTETPLGTEGIALLFSINGSPGTYAFKVIGNAGLEAEVEMAKGSFVLTAEKDSANIIVRLRPFTTASFGKKPVAMEVNGVRHNFHYEIRRREESKTSAAGD